MLYVGNIIMPELRVNYLSVKEAAGRIHPVTYITEARRVVDRREAGGRQVRETEEYRRESQGARSLWRR